ncbi:ABC transporter permease [Undibacterium sp. CY18W]|uniref:ABC transporter permease n=1 Tax=Undibacterium hunanense TaxID=2762292 RepID=A0ABR6ZTY1_9BURK|nr:ABC transporter permease [Undibacterium hunanense]MBC3919300.1 ABC transporter permease [Undibacterium hunanense]
MTDIITSNVSPSMARHVDLVWQQRLRLFFAVFCALLIGFLVTATVSKEPVRAYLTMLTGPLPEIRWSDLHGWQLRRMVRFGSVIEDTITLSFLGLAVAIPFRARQFSLGADGQLFLSALAAAAVSLYLGDGFPFLLPIVFVAAILTGFTWGLLPGVLKARYQVNEIVSTLMLNLIAVQLYRLIISEYMRDPGAGFLVTPVLPSSAIFSGLIAHTNVSTMLYLLPFVVFAAWYLLMRTTTGYEIRTVGSAPAFARRVGMPVTRSIILSMAFGGAFAAFAGLHISNGLLKRLPVELSPGLGFDGLVVSLLARNDPKAIPMAAFFYAYLRTGAQAMERTTDVSREVVQIVQALIILFVVAEHLIPAGFSARLRQSWNSFLQKFNYIHRLKGQK